jgi:hypothetical protein
LALQAW